MSLNIDLQLDAGNVTGGVDGALQTLERIKALIESTEPYGERLARNSKVNVDGLLAQMRKLATDTEGAFRRMDEAMKLRQPAAIKRALAELNDPMRRLIDATVQLNNVKFKGIDGIKAAANTQKATEAVQRLADQYDHAARRANRLDTQHRLAMQSLAQVNATAMVDLDRMTKEAMARVSNFIQNHPATRAPAPVQRTPVPAGAINLQATTGTPWTGGLGAQQAAAAGAAQSATALAAATATATSAAIAGTSASNQLTQSLGQQLAAGNNLHSMYRGLASGFGAMWLTWGAALPVLTGAAISHSITSMVKQGAELDHTYKTISALGEVAAADIAKMNEEVLRLGASSTYGPREVAKSLETLTLAGLSAKESMEALQPVLDFSKVGGQSLEVAAETLVAVSTAYGYSVDQFSYVSDVISKTAAISMVSTADMAASFRVASAIAQQYKVELEDTAVALALLGQAGIRGQAAGTAVRQMYNELMGTTKKAREELDKLGVSIFDNANGKMKQLGQIMGELSQGLQGMDFEGVMRSLDKLGNERGTKALASSLQAMAKEAQATGKDFENEFARVTAAVRSAAGFTATAAREMETSTQSLMAGVGASLETTLMQGFQRAKPAVDEFMITLREALNADGLAVSLGQLLRTVMELSTLLVKVAGIMANGLPVVLALGGAFVTAKAAVMGATAGLQVFSGVALALTGVGATAAAGLRLILGAVFPLSAALVALYGAWLVLQHALGQGAGKKAVDDLDAWTKQMRDGAADYHKQAERINAGADATHVAEMSRRDELAGALNDHYKNEIVGLQRTIRQREQMMAGLNRESVISKKLSEQQQADQAKLNSILDERKKKLFDADTALMMNEAGRTAWSNAVQAQHKKKQEELNKRLGLNPDGSPKADPSGGSGSGGSSGGRAKNLLADETRALQQAQATRAALEEELYLRRQFPDTYEGMTASAKRLHLLNIQLNATTIDGARALTGQERALKQAEIAELTKTVALEKAIKVEQDAAAARKKLADDTKRLEDSLNDEADKLEAANAVYGKGKVAIEEMTLAKMWDAAATGESVKIGNQMVTVTAKMIDGQTRLIDAMKKAEWKAFNQKLDEQQNSLNESVAALEDEVAFLGLVGRERKKILEIRKIERQLASDIEKLHKSEMTPAEIAAGVERKRQLADQAIALVEMQDAFGDLSQMVGQFESDLTSAFMNSFEQGRLDLAGFKSAFKKLALEMIKPLVVQYFIQPIMGSLGGILGVVGSLLGGAGSGQGGAGSLLGTASNLNSAWGMLNGTGTGLSGIGYNMLAGLPGSVGYGMLPGMTVGSQQAAMLAAQTQAFGGAGLQATAGAAQTAQGASWMAGNAAGIAAVAAPLIIGSLIERNARDRFSGAAYATSGGNDPFANTIAGSTGFDYLTGDLPDRAALMARLEELGAPMEAISDWNDRALLRLMESAAADNSEFGINWTSRVRDMRDTPDFYRGAGYAHPEELGWWNNKDNANLSTDPALIQASRDIALSIIGPLEGIGALIGDEAAYRATVGFANRGEGNGLWAGLNLQRDGQNVADWVNTDDFHSVGEAVRAMYSTALGTLDSFDLPGWADKQVTDARTALDALEGENMGQEAAALYAQTTAGIEQMYRSIQRLIDMFPDFSNATQDAVYALAELMGGMDNLASAYGSYLSNFYSEEERRQLMFKELDSELDKLGIDTIPRTRAEFRELVSAQDLSTEAGREAFTVLMKLSGGFAEFVDAAESAADNARERIDSIFGQISKLWDEQISNWSKLSSEAKSVFDVAIKAAKDLRGQVADTRQWDARTANAYIDQALAGLRATGALPDSKELADAIAAARGGLDMSQYDTLADMERDQLILAGKLNEIGDSAEVQMSFAEQQVQLLEQQRDYWRQQIDLLNATGETITSIDQGIEYLADYVREQAAIKAAEEAEKEASREAARRAAPSISPGDWGGGGWGGGGGQDLTSITRTINWETGEYVYPDGSGGTMSAEELEYFRKILDGELDPTRIISDLYQVPRHADGGRYAGGLALVGERGPELINFDSPGHVYTAVQTRDMMRGGDNAELIDELRELRARLDKIERNTAVLPQTHDVIDRVTAGGNAMLTEAA